MTSEMTTRAHIQNKVLDFCNLSFNNDEVLKVEKFKDMGVGNIFSVFLNFPLTKSL